MTLYPGSQQVPPMRYANKPNLETILKTWDSGKWIAQEKKDGAWYQLEKTDDGEIYLFGRTVSKNTGEYTEKIANVPHIESWATYLPNGTTLIGEIYVPGGKSNDATKIMGCTAENAYKRQFKTDVYGGPIHYYVFDCIRWAKEDLINKTTVERLKYLENIQPLILEMEKGIAGPSYIELAPTYYDDFANRLNQIFEAGGEGMVFKKKDCPYRAGKRTTASQMYKYKEHMDSIDLICMRLEPATKEYTGKELESWPYWMERSEMNAAGDYNWFHANRNCYEDYLNNPHIFMPVTKPYYNQWITAMTLGAVKDEKVIPVCRVASGFTDEMREDMGLYPWHYLNHVIEIECMSINKKDGTIRHPVFRRVREDKDMEDCRWEEIFK